MFGSNINSLPKAWKELRKLLKIQIYIFICREEMKTYYLKFFLIQNQMVIK